MLAKKFGPLDSNPAGQTRNRPMLVHKSAAQSFIEASGSSHRLGLADFEYWVKICLALLFKFSFSLLHFQVFTILKISKGERIDSLACTTQQNGL
jgi:hypothetical protein